MPYQAPICLVMDLVIQESLMQTSIGDWNVDPNPLG